MRGSDARQEQCLKQQLNDKPPQQKAGRCDGLAGTGPRGPKQEDCGHQQKIDCRRDDDTALNLNRAPIEKREQEDRPERGDGNCPEIVLKCERLGLRGGQWFWQGFGGLHGFSAFGNWLLWRCLKGR